MRRSSHIAAYEDAFAGCIGVRHALAFWKGRVALYALLRALGVGKGDEVILPGYTCVMDVNPIVYLGARPVYVDIDPVTFNLNPDLVASRVSGRTRAIIAQHTYGYPAEMDALVTIASSRGLTLLEDCCLAVGSRYKGKPVSSFGSGAFWSSQWNKPFTTGLGGMATTNDDDLAQRMREICRAELVRPSPVAVGMLRLEIAAHRALVYPRTTALAQTIFRKLTRSGVVVGSWEKGEFDPVMPARFFKGMSDMQARYGLRQLSRLDRMSAHRRALTRLYVEMLTERGWDQPAIPEHLDPVLVRYPIRVSDKRRALAEAARESIELGSWFESPLHPAETRLESYGYQPGMCPEAERACREVVNLPVHPRVSEATVKRTVQFILRFRPH